MKTQKDLYDLINSANLSDEGRKDLERNLRDLLTRSKPTRVKKTHIRSSSKVTLRKKSAPVRYTMNKCMVQIKHDEVLKHYIEDTISEVEKMSFCAYKMNFIELCEMLAELEKEKEGRDFYRGIGGKMLMIDSYDHLLNFVVSFLDTVKKS